MEVWDERQVVNGEVGEKEMMTRGGYRSGLDLKLPSPVPIGPVQVLVKQMFKDFSGPKHVSQANTSIVYLGKTFRIFVPRVYGCAQCSLLCNSPQPLPLNGQLKYSMAR